MLNVEQMLLPKSPAWVSPTVDRRISLEKARTAAVRKAFLPKDFPVPQLAEHPVDIITIKKEDRAHLLTGPKISVVADGNVVIRKNIPIRALMASSTKLHDLLQVKRSITQFRIYGKVDKNCIERLLDVFTTEQGLNADKINLVSGSLIKDILMYQACSALGIYSDHSKPLLNALRAQVSVRLLTFDEMNTIINRVRSTDPLFRHLANDLCHRRYKKRIADIPAFEQWLSKSSKRELKNMMMEIDQGKKRVRQANRACAAAAMVGPGDNMKEKKGPVILNSPLIVGLNTGK
jgi:hypothetical protein